MSSTVCLVTSCGGLTLKPLHLLGSVYYLMSSAQLDSLCQWGLLNEACSLAKMNLASTELGKVKIKLQNTQMLW